MRNVTTKQVEQGALARGTQTHDARETLRLSRRFVVPRYRGPGVMTLVEEPLPEPGSGEVRVVAAGVGYPDLLMREGTYPDVPKPPFTPGYEFVGTVDKLGPGATIDPKFSMRRLRLLTCPPPR